MSAGPFTLLAVHAHPDDESSGTGGLLRLAAEQGLDTARRALGTDRFEEAWRVGDAASAFARAAQVARLSVKQQRLSAVAMEPRAVLATYDPNLDELTVWTSTQSPFRVRSAPGAAGGRTVSTD